MTETKLFETEKPRRIQTYAQRFTAQTYAAFHAVNKKHYYATRTSQTTLDSFRAFVSEQLATRARCPYCNCLLGLGNLSLDHKTPLALGGKHELENFELICQNCNTAKGDFTREVFLEILCTAEEAGIKFRQLNAKDRLIERLAHGSRQVHKIRTSRQAARKRAAKI